MVAHDTLGMAEIASHDVTQSAIGSGPTLGVGRAVERHAIDENEGSNVPEQTEDGQMGDGRIGNRGYCGVVLQ